MIWFLLGVVLGFVGFVLLAIWAAAREGRLFGDPYDVFDTDP